MTHGFRTDLGRSGYWIMSLAELRGTRNRASEAAAILLVDNTYGIFSAMNRIAYLLEIFEIMRFSDLNVNNLWCWTSAIHRLKECLFFLTVLVHGIWDWTLKSSTSRVQKSVSFQAWFWWNKPANFQWFKLANPRNTYDSYDDLLICLTFFFGCVFAFWVWWDIIIPTDSGRNVDPHPV